MTPISARVNRSWTKSIRADTRLKTSFHYDVFSFTKKIGSKGLPGVAVECFELLLLVLNCFLGQLCIVSNFGGVVMGYCGSLWFVMIFFYCCGSLWAVVRHCGHLCRSSWIVLVSTIVPCFSKYAIFINLQRYRVLTGIIIAIVFFH